MDKLTRDRCFADFTVWAARENLDVSAFFEGLSPSFIDPLVQAMYIAYIAGRIEQGAVICG